MISTGEMTVVQAYYDKPVQLAAGFQLVSSGVEAVDHQSGTISGFK